MLEHYLGACLTQVYLEGSGSEVGRPMFEKSLVENNAVGSHVRGITHGDQIVPDTTMSGCYQGYIGVILG